MALSPKLVAKWHRYEGVYSTLGFDIHQESLRQDNIKKEMVIKWIEKYYHIQKDQFDIKNIETIYKIYKISLPKVLGLVFSSLAATTLARSLDKRGERRKVIIEFWFQTSDNIYQWVNFISGRFSFSSDPRLGSKRKQWSSRECVKKKLFFGSQKVS